MDNTWSLLPETNHSLLIPTSFSLRDYRVSLQKTYGFLSNLNADVIYPTFRGEPALETHAALTDRARYNLEVSRLYLAAKLVALGVVEALALRSAPHTPVALLLGEDPGTIPGRAEPEPFSLVGEHPPAFNSKVEEDVYGLLATGRTQKTSYDLNNSPLAANFFAILGPAGISVRINSAEAFFAEEITGDEYIALFPPELVAPIKERITKLMELRIAAVNRAP